MKCKCYGKRLKNRQKKYCSIKCSNNGKHNPNFRKICSEEIRIKLSKAKVGNKNPNWNGNNVGYASLHEWIKNRKPKPEFCEECGIKKPYDLANISGEYKRDINDYEWICRSCHMKKDGRMKRLHSNNKRWRNMKLWL